MDTSCWPLLHHTHAFVFLEAFLLCLSLLLSGCGNRGSSQESIPVNGFPLALGKEWTYAVCDTQGVCEDTLVATVVGYSSPSGDAETSIWFLHAARGGIPRLFFAAETLFVARSFNTISIQQQNQCYPHLTLNFPLKQGQWWRTPDPTVFDSIVVAGWDSVAVPIGVFPKGLRIEEHRFFRDSVLTRQIWIVPEIGIVKMQESSTVGAQSGRVWELVSFKP